MFRNFLFFTLFFLLGSFTSAAQDDTEEETNGVAFFEEAELRKEKEYLTFKEAFIESLRQRGIEKYNKALESLVICEGIYPENIAMLFEQAKNSFDLKQYVEAHYYCNKALAIEPTNFWIKSLSRDIYEKQQNYTEAIAIQKELYKIKTSEATRLLKLYYRTKNKEEGRKLIAEIDKNATPVLGIDFYKRYFNSKTKKVVRKPVKPITNQEKDLETLQKDFSKTHDFKILEKILEKEHQTKQYKKLLNDSKLGLEIFPAQAKVYLYNGLALNALSKHTEAVVVLETGLDYVFDDPNLSKQFYTALINGYQNLSNSKKVNHYKQLVQKLN